MRNILALTLCWLFLAGLISACSTPENVLPGNPLVGQWEINRQITSDIPDSYSANGTLTANLTPNTYAFRGDSTFTNNYVVVNPNGTQYSRTDNGTWALAGPVGTIAVVTLQTTSISIFVTSQSLPVTSPPLPITYTLAYSASTEELTTRPLVRTYNGPDPNTGIINEFNYTEKLVYKRKR